MKMFINEYESDSDGNLINFKAELEIMAEHVSEVRSSISPIFVGSPLCQTLERYLILTLCVSVCLCIRVRTGSCSCWAHA